LCKLNLLPTSSLAKWRVRCFFRSELLNQSSGIFSNFGAEKPPLRQAAGRCASFKPDANGKVKNGLTYPKSNLQNNDTK